MLSWHLSAYGLPFAINVMLTLSIVIWPLGAAQFILGVLVVIVESANFVLKVMKIQCFFSISLDPKHAFGPY